MRKAIHQFVMLIIGIAGIVTMPAAAADRDKGLLKLPAPGAWARYHNVVIHGDKQVGDRTFLLKSLNAVKVDGAQCRWMESEYLEDQGSPKLFCRKFLIPEVALRMSDKPSDRIARFLERTDKNPVIRLAPEFWDRVPVDFLYLPGFLKNAVRVEAPKTIRHRTGTLDIPAAYEGLYRGWPKGHDPEKSTLFETRYRVWLHPDLPIGFACAELEVKVIQDGRENSSASLEFTLEDFGENAQPTIVEESIPGAKPAKN